MIHRSSAPACYSRSILIVFSREVHPWTSTHIPSAELGEIVSSPVFNYEREIP